MKISPTDLSSFVLFLADSVYLQSNKAFWCHIVYYITGGYAIDPGADIVTDAFYTSLIPLVLFERSFCRRVQVKRIEPVPPRFIIDSACPATFGGIDLVLVAMHSSVFKIGFTFAAELHA